MKNKTVLKDYLMGLPLGLGILPGVSMATVGFFINIYERLITNMNNLKKNFWGSLKIVLPIGLGSLTTTIGLYFLVNTAFNEETGGFPIIIMSICAGLTFGCLPILFKELSDKKIDGKDIARIILGFAIAAGIGILSALSKEFNWFSVGDAFLNPNQNWWIYIIIPFIGFIAAVACMIPGISGAMIMFVAGIYGPLMKLYVGQYSMFHNKELIGPGIILTLELAVGVVIGLFAMSSCMEKLLNNHRRGVFGWVIGLVLGSIVAMFMNDSIWYFYKQPLEVALWQYIVGAILIIGLGIGLSTLIRKISKRRGTKQIVNE